MESDFSTSVTEYRRPGNKMLDKIMSTQNFMPNKQQDK